MGLVKTLNIPAQALKIFYLENLVPRGLLERTSPPGLEILEYIIAGIFGLFSILALRGIFEEIFVNNYATMGGEDPTQGSSSLLGSKTGGVGAAATNTSDDAYRRKR